MTNHQDSQDFQAEVNIKNQKIKMKTRLGKLYKVQNKDIIMGESKLLKLV